MSRPDLFDYADYRRYLSDWFEHKKAGRQGQGRAAYSHDMFRQEAGVSNRGVLVSIIKGRKNLTEGLLHAFRKPLELGDEEASFLKLLVERERAQADLAKAQARRTEAAAVARAPDAKKRARSALEAAEQGVASAKATLANAEGALVGARKMHRALVMSDQHVRLTNAWSTVALLELVRCPSFREDPAWIAEVFGGKVSAETMAETLAMLEEIGQLRRDGSGRLVPADETTMTALEVRAALVDRFYTGVHEQAGLAMRRSFEDREFALQCRLGTMMVAIPSSELPRVREGVLEIRRRLFAFFEGIHGEPDMVYAVWLQAFPLTGVLPGAAGIAPDGRRKKGERGIEQDGQ